MSAQAPCVGVVIPAHNAEATLDATLHSVRAQTHAALEIVVVDDGSGDGTAAIARRHAAADARVAVVVQDNAGVAAARNAGWQRVRADVVAFIDADDLWAPDKIERQLRCLQAHGERVGLVYCGFARIDVLGRIVSVHDHTTCEGDVLNRLCSGNFVGNGSTALVRRQALVAAGGFDVRLQAQGAWGCEDWLLYCRVAASHHFAVVPDALVGYRSLPNNMSSDRPRMFASWLLVAQELRTRHPDNAAAVRQGVRNYAGWLIGDALDNGARLQAAVLVRRLLRHEPRLLLPVLGGCLRARLGRLRRRLRALGKPRSAASHPHTGAIFLAGRVEPGRPA